MRLGIASANVTVQADAKGSSRRFGAGMGITQNGIGTEAAPVGRAVQID